MSVVATTLLVQEIATTVDLQTYLEAVEQVLDKEEGEC